MRELRIVVGEYKYHVSEDGFADEHSYEDTRNTIIDLIYALNPQTVPDLIEEHEITDDVTTIYAPCGEPLCELEDE